MCPVACGLSPMAYCLQFMPYGLSRIPCGTHSVTHNRWLWATGHDPLLVACALWIMACILWHVACGFGRGLWPTVYCLLQRTYGDGLWLMACCFWPIANGTCLWTMAFVLWYTACGLWRMAQGIRPSPVDYSKLRAAFGHGPGLWPGACGSSPIALSIACCAQPMAMA